jgi:hypothetical protein
MVITVRSEVGRGEGEGDVQNEQQKRLPVPMFASSARKSQVAINPKT